MITIIFMIVTGFILNGLVIKQSIEKQQLQNKIDRLEEQLNSKIDELGSNLIDTKYSLQTGLSIINDNISEVNDEIIKIRSKNYEDFSSIIQRSITSVVSIKTLSMQGTGFIVDEKGYIVTNAHILTNTFGNTTQIIQASTYDEKVYPAKIIYIDANLDLVLLKIDGNFSRLELADSDNLEIGEKVIAIGNAEGFPFSVTDGIVSAIDRVGPNNLPYYIQTNAELNQGNSGGPLIDKDGLVIGMNNFKLADTEGMGFALESNIIKERINNISEELLNTTLIS